MALMAPILEILFGMSEEVKNLLPWAVNLNVIKHNLYYYVTIFKESNGAGMTLLFVGLFVIIATMLKVGFAYLGAFEAVYIRNGVVKDMREQIYAKIMKLALPFFSEERKGDIIKVGIGPGSVCTTRIKTGVGYPQLSAIIECADAAHGLAGHIISDGGCLTPGDVAKAFGAGADFVMLGGMLAGHTESGGELIEIEGEKFKQFYGMSSTTAMEKHVGGVAEYRASEGKTVQVPYKGNVGNTLKDILGGLRSACTYVGASRLKELTKRTTFIRVSEQENTVYTK